jgi:hypothetical protein
LIADETLKWVRIGEGPAFLLFFAITLPHGRHEIDDLGILQGQAMDPDPESVRCADQRCDRDVGRLGGIAEGARLSIRTRW